MAENNLLNRVGGEPSTMALMFRNHPTLPREPILEGLKTEMANKIIQFHIIQYI